jgi:hypothetical protein
MRAKSSIGGGVAAEAEPAAAANVQNTAEARAMKPMILPGRPFSA